MGTLNLGGSATYSGNSTGLTQAPPGTIITVAYGILNSNFSTTSDGNVDTGLATSALVKKMPNGSAAGTSRIHVYCFGGNRDSNTEAGQDVTSVYRSVNGQTFYERDYMDSSYYGGYWHPHACMYVDTSVGAMGAGASVVYKMYVRSRGGSNTIYFHREIGGVSGACYMMAQEIVN